MNRRSHALSGLTLAQWTSIALVSIAPTVATATTNSIDIQTFNPSTSDQFVFIEDTLRPTWPRPTVAYLGVNYNWLRDPLVVTDATLTGRVQTLVSAIQTVDVFGGYQLTPRVAVYVGAPIMNVLSFPNGTYDTAFGDIRALAKIRLTNDDAPTSVALIPEVHFPTGSTSDLTTDSSFYMSGKISVEHQFSTMTIAANVGYINASNSQWLTVDFRNRWFLGLGALIPLTERVGINTEFVDQVPIPTNPYLSPNEFYAGVRVQVNGNLVLTGGASIGAVTGPTGQDVRAVVGLRYTWFGDRYPSAAPLPMPTPEPTPKKPLAVYTTKRIEILHQINFEHNSAELTPDARDVLDEVAKLIVKHKASFKRILVDGHTNKIGTEEYNTKLSMERAQSVKDYLVSKNVPANWLQTRGFGSKHPRVPYTNPDADDINRRVEFIVQH